MLSFDHVSCRVAERYLLQDISLMVRPGEVVAIIGKNGAGKSTLLQVASGLRRPDQGRVSLDGELLHHICPKRLSMRRAMLTQETPMQARFTVEDVVAMGVQAYPLARRQKLVAMQLERVALSALAQRDITSLSGGERQRAHFARVLAQLDAGAEGSTPGLLLLDEPISAQDLARQGVVLDVAREHAQRGGSCLMVLHDLNWSAARSDRIVMLLDGGIYTQGAPEDVLTPQALKDVFGVTVPSVFTHCGTRKPFIIPHDFNNSVDFLGDDQSCILQ
nr:heme ABC transporter ATP-binding protein [uncultured Neokomagataea sp.]